MTTHTESEQEEQDRPDKLSLVVSVKSQRKFRVKLTTVATRSSLMWEKNPSRSLSPLLLFMVGRFMVDG